MWKFPQMELFIIPQRLRMLEDIELKVGSALWYLYGGFNFSQGSVRQSALSSHLSSCDFTLTEYQIAWNEWHFLVPPGDCQPSLEPLVVLVRRI